MKLPAQLPQHLWGMMTRWWCISKWWCSKKAKSSTCNISRRTGILPEACYQKELRSSATIACHGAIDSEQGSTESDTDNTDEVLEYNTDIDDKEIIKNKIGSWKTFLLGANSRFGRSIKFNQSFFESF